MEKVEVGGGVPQCYTLSTIWTSEPSTPPTPPEGRCFGSCLYFSWKKPTCSTSPLCTSYLPSELVCYVRCCIESMYTHVLHQLIQRLLHSLDTHHHKMSHLSSPTPQATPLIHFLIALPCGDARDTMTSGRSPLPISTMTLQPAHLIRGRAVCRSVGYRPKQEFESTKDRHHQHRYSTAFHTSSITPQITLDSFPSSNPNPTQVCRMKNQPNS